MEKHVIVFAGPLLASGGGDLAFGLLVELVPDANEGERLRVLRSRILIEAVPPAGERLKGLLISYIIDEGAAVSTAVKGVAKRLELLLSSSVPDLESNHSVVY